MADTTTSSPTVPNDDAVHQKGRNLQFIGKLSRQMRYCDLMVKWYEQKQHLLHANDPPYLSDCLYNQWHSMLYQAHEFCAHPTIQTHRAAECALKYLAEDLELYTAASKQPCFPRAAPHAKDQTLRCQHFTRQKCALKKLGTALVACKMLLPPRVFL